MAAHPAAAEAAVAGACGGWNPSEPPSNPSPGGVLEVGSGSGDDVAVGDGVVVAGGTVAGPGDEGGTWITGVIAPEPGA